jgi:hypothetical protein
MRESGPVPRARFSAAPARAGPAGGVFGRGTQMQEPRDSSLGGALGVLAVVGGILWFGLGLATVWKGQGPDGVDGLVFGGLAVVSGCVILQRRAQAARHKRDGSGTAGPDSAPTQPPD